MNKKNAICKIMTMTMYFSRRTTLSTYAIVCTLLFILIYYSFSNDLRHAKESRTTGKYNMILKDLHHELTSAEENGTADVMFTFTKAKENAQFVMKFKTCLSSLLEYSTIHLNFHLITDEASQLVASRIIDSVLTKSKTIVHSKVIIIMRSIIH